MFNFQIIKKSPKNKARTGIFVTPHGPIETPQLAFVATEGEIKCLPKDRLPYLPVNLIIVNTFHIWVKNILQKIGQKTIHHYANFKKPIMSDSGGFQVFSMGFGKAHGVGKMTNIFPEESRKNQIKSDKSDLSGLSDLPMNADDSRFFPNSSDTNNPLKITEQGVEFMFNGQKVLLTPEKSIEIQQKIGADIIFAFDECTSPLNSYSYTKKALERTNQWLIRCLNQLKSIYSKTTHSPPQALFAIVQGGNFEDLRKKSAKYCAQFDVPGFGIGGSLGKTKTDMFHILDWVIPYLPEEKPRHLLGIGQVVDIFQAVKRGVDLFDCVIPTREARHQVIYTRHGKKNLRQMKTVAEVVDKNCQCQLCQEKITFTKLYHLYRLNKPQAFYYLTVHNIQFFSDLLKEIRLAINLNRLDELEKKYLDYF